MWLYIFSSICAWNMSSFGDILVPKGVFFISKGLLGWNIWRTEVDGKFEMQSGHGDQNSKNI